MVGVTRSRTDAFRRYRQSLRSHRPGPRTTTELKDFKVQKNLLAPHSDDEGSTMDVRVYSIPPVWVTLVDDMNRDITQIKIKSTQSCMCTSRLTTSAGLLMPHSRPIPALSFGAQHFDGQSSTSWLCGRRRSGGAHCIDCCRGVCSLQGLRATTEGAGCIEE